MNFLAKRGSPLATRRVRRSQTIRGGLTLLGCGVLAPLVLVRVAIAAPGDLDPGFGSGGIVTTRINFYGDAANALALQPDGKLIAAGVSSDGLAGHFALVRYEPNGSLDSTFGTGGKVASRLGSANAVLLQPDGRIVAVGTSGDFALARYLVDGSPDPSFGSDGTVTTPIGVPGRASALAAALQADERSSPQE